MKAYSKKGAAIIRLHEKGFTEDFQFVGENILWVQQRLLLSLEEISLLEIHRIPNTADGDTVVFGVIASQLGIQGILITCSKRPSAIEIPGFGKYGQNAQLKDLSCMRWDDGNAYLLAHY